jgi:hypothetical protein
MQLLVRSLIGKEIVLSESEADHKMTVGEVKERLAGGNGCNATQVRLLHQGALLEDSQTLAETVGMKGASSLAGNTLELFMDAPSLSSTFIDGVKTAKSPVQDPIIPESMEPQIQPSTAKGRCIQDGCLLRAARIIGDCRYCEGVFCARHRLPESHSCGNISRCRQQSFEKNSEKLLSEKCVADKV